MDPDGNTIMQLLSVNAASPQSGSFNPFLYIFILIVLILLNGFFAGSEIAIVTLNDNKIRRMAEDGHKKAKLVLKLVDEPTKFLATIQFGVTISGYLASAIAADTFAEPISAFLVTFIPLGYDLIRAIILILLTILLSFFTIIFGEMVPKRLAMHNPEKMAFSFAPALAFIYKVSKPFIYILSRSTNGVIRLFGINPHDEPEEVTEEEILMMVDVGKEKGVIEESQKDMITNIFEFDDTTAEEVMTHRTDIVAVDIEDNISDIIYYAINEGYSRIPVYKEDLDNIVGIIYVKDLLCLVGCDSSQDFKIKDFIRPALYIPASNKLREVFTQLTEKKLQMAVVVDEYGGTAGLITMEDLLESIVGNIQDEYDDEDEEIAQISDNVFTIEGTTDLDEVAKLLNIEISEDYDYDTLGGLITDLLGRIPEPDETPPASVIFENIKFTVLSVEERRIMKVRAEKLPEPVEEQESEE